MKMLERSHFDPPPQAAILEIVLVSHANILWSKLWLKMINKVIFKNCDSVTDIYHVVN